MGFSIHGNIKNIVDEAEMHAQNLDKEKLDSTVGKIRNYFENKSNPLYRRFLRLKTNNIVGIYESKKSSIEESSYLMDLAGQ